MTAHITTDLAAYVLGSLDDDDRAAVDAHLLDCPICAAELADLAGLPMLLDRVGLDDLDAMLPSRDLFEHVLAAVDERPRRRLAQTLLAAAAAAVLLAGIGTAVGVTAGQHHPHRFMAAAAGVRITVTPTAQSAGTALEVSVSGLPENEHCHLVAISSDGTTHVAGDWVATYAGKARVTGSTEVPRNDLVRVVLYGTHDQELVSVAV